MARLLTKIREELISFIVFFVFIGIVLWLMAAIAKGQHFLTSLVFFLSVSISFFALRAASKSGVRTKVSALLISYLGIMFTYGAVYFSVYSDNASTFSFASSIDEGKARDRIDADRERIKQLTQKSELIQMLADHPAEVLQALRNPYRAINNHPGPNENIFQITNEYSIRFLYIDKVGFQLSAQESYVEVFNNNKMFRLGDSWNIFDFEVLAIRDLMKSKTQVELEAALVRTQHGVKSALERANDDFRADEKKQPQWELLDFVYFSSVVMTTLGFGDIVPNSLQVRLLVVSQSVLSVFFLGFGLIFLWTKRENQELSDDEA